MKFFIASEGELIAPVLKPNWNMPSTAENMAAYNINAILKSFFTLSSFNS